MSFEAKKKIGILGSGEVGQTLARAFASTRYEVKIGSRSPEKLESGIVEEFAGRVSFGTFDQAASYGDLLVLATLGEAAEKVIDLAGQERFSGKTLIDVTNPLDFSKGMPPGLLPEFQSVSLGETVQRKLPSTRVVKCFNIVPNTVMFRPKFSEAEMLLCGNDAGAKQEVSQVVKEFGWAGAIDLGGIQNAKWLEALVILWVRTAAAAGAWNSMFQFVR